MLHIGTHKTGTKTLQMFMTVNREALESSGVHVIRSGRVELGDQTFTPGHHRLAWEVIHDQGRSARAEIIAELNASHAPVAFASSEDLEYLVHYHNGALAEMKREFEGAGYRVIAVVSLRRQDGYAESIYGQFVRGSVVRRFADFVDEIERTGIFDPFGSENVIAFDYHLFLARIAEIFGGENVIARPWRPNADARALPTDLLRVVSRFVPGGMQLANLQNPLPFANVRDTLRVLLDTARSSLDRPELPHAHEVAMELRVASDVLERRFAALSYDETIRLLERFGPSNARVKESMGCDIGFDSLDHIAPAEHPHWADAAEQRRVLDAVLDRWLPPGTT